MTRIGAAFLFAAMSGAGLGVAHLQGDVRFASAAAAGCLAMAIAGREVERHDPVKWWHRRRRERQRTA